MKRLHRRRRPTWNPTSASDVIDHVAEHPEVLEDCQLWPRLVMFRSALTTIIDSPDRFCPQTRSLAWIIRCLHPQMTLPLHWQDRIRGKRYLKNNAAAIAENAEKGIATLGAGSELLSAIAKLSHRSTKRGAYDRDVRALFQRIGALVILERPELTGKRLQEEVEARVRYEIKANVLPLTAPRSQDGRDIQKAAVTTSIQDRKDHRIRHRVSCGPNWGRKWNPTTSQWERNTEDRYIRTEVLEAELVRKTIDSAEPMDLLDHVGDALFQDPGNQRARKAARAQLAKLDGAGTKRQWDVVEAITFGDKRQRGPRTAAERQALRRLRRQSEKRLRSDD